MPMKTKARVLASLASSKPVLLPLACATLLLAHATSFAQAAPAVPSQATPSPATPSPSVPAAAGTPAQASRPAAVDVTSVEVEGNTLLSNEQLRSATAPALGSGRTLADLNAAAARVQAAYREAGYGGVVAFVPEQDVSSGRLLIRVVEGKLAGVRVKGNQHFSEQNVRAGLPNLVEGRTPLVRAIDRDIQLSNENPAKELRVTLEPGARPGEVDADITVADMKPLQLLLGYSNTGNAITGRGRLTLGVRHANISGHDDVVTAQYQTSVEHPQQVHVATLGYHLPLYAYGGSVDAFYAHSNVDNGTTLTPIGPLAFSGRGDLLSLRGNLNLERRSDLDQRIFAGLDWKKFENECSLGVFGEAACGPAGVDVRAVPIVFGYTAQRQEGGARSWGASASVAVNAAGSNAATFDAARPGARRHYGIARLAAFGEWAFGAGWGASARLDSQYSPHALIPGERFGMGGITSVRGYEEREMTGDSGVTLRLDVLMPSLAAVAGSAWRLRPLLFADAGHVSNHKGFPCRQAVRSSCSASGAGVGLRAGFSTIMSATLDVARALRDGDTTAKGDTRVHVSLTVVY